MNIGAKYIKTPVSSPIDIRSLVTIYRIDYDSENFKYVGESHDFYELICVESGTYHNNVNGETLTLLPGEVVIYSPYAFHEKSKESCKALIYIVSFETASPIEADIYDKPIRLSSKQYIMLSELFTDALQVQKEMSRNKTLHGMTLINSDNRLALQKVKNKLELLLIDICEASAPKSTHITASNSDNVQSADLIKVGEFLKSNISKNLSLSDIASGCSMSVSKLKKLFARTHPGGVIDYFNTLKIEEAKHLIRNTDSTFTEIATGLGFTYPHYFSRLFKIKTGMTPSEYAKHIDKR